jgi:hypothetical protein
MKKRTTNVAKEGDAEEIDDRFVAVAADLVDAPAEEPRQDQLANRRGDDQDDRGDRLSPVGFEKPDQTADDRLVVRLS